MTDATWLPVYEDPGTEVIDNEWELVELEDLRVLERTAQAMLAMAPSVLRERYGFYVHPEMFEHIRSLGPPLEHEPTRLYEMTLNGFEIQTLANIPLDWIAFMNYSRVTLSGDVLEPLFILEKASTRQTMTALHGGEADV